MEFMDNNGNESKTMENESITTKLQRAFKHPGDCNNEAIPPPWLNRDLFDRGRKFNSEFMFCVFFSQVMGLLSLFSMDRVLKILMLSGNSSTPEKAAKRYISTARHVLMWSEEDIWTQNTKSRRDLLRIRQLHRRIAVNLYDKHNSNADNNANQRSEPDIWAPTIRKDFASALHTRDPLQPMFYEDTEKDPLFLSQFDMVMTQYSFVGYLILHPYFMGVHRASKEDLEGFAHFWRGIGWLLGISDEYNLCSGTLDDVKKYCLEIERNIIATNMAKVSSNYEKMSQSLINGIGAAIPGVTFESVFMYLMTIHGIAIQSFNISWSNFFHLILIKFTFYFLFTVPGMLWVYNYLLKLALGKYEERMRSR